MGSVAHPREIVDVRRWVVDVAVALAVGAAACLTIEAAREPGARPPDLGAYVLGISMGLVLLLRRRRPLTVLLVSSGLLLAYYSVGYPGFPPAVVLAVPLYSATVARHLAWAVGVSAAFIGAAVVVVGFRLHDLEGVVQIIGLDAALLAVVILLGEVVRSRRERLTEAAAHLAAVEAQREREAWSRVADERLRIARDVHDIVGHAVATIGVHAGLAEEALGQDPDQARESLQIVRRTAKGAMAELKAAISLLRVPDAGTSATSGRTLDDLDELIASATGPALTVACHVEGTARPLSRVVSQSAYRVVQEALTNTARHAGATTAIVCVGYAPDQLVLDIRDDGHGVTGQLDRGHGLHGMAERVEALGGTLRTGNGRHGGFDVVAAIPLDTAR